jgi:hypothetical protein
VWIVEYFKALEAELVQAERPTGDNKIMVESLKKCSKMSIKILCGILLAELSRQPKSCRVLAVLQGIPSVDHVQQLLLDKLLRCLCKQDVLKREPANAVRNITTALRV